MTWTAIRVSLRDHATDADAPPNHQRRILVAGGTAALAAAAVLTRVDRDGPALLERRLPCGPEDLLDSRVVRRH